MSILTMIPDASLPMPQPRLGMGLDTVLATLAELKAIRTLIEQEFVEGVDFGQIPNTGDKKTLLQPGAHKCLFFFNCYAEHTCTITELPGGHREVLVTATVKSRVTQQKVGEGIGSCSTREKKYRLRNCQRLCPSCNKPHVMQSKDEKRPEWYCWKKPGGCGQRYAIDDQRITSQTVGTIDNPDIEDTYNTVLKMGIKRADVAAAMALGCLSDRFTQDLDDMDVYTSADVRATETKPAAHPKAAQEAAPAAAAPPAHYEGSYETATPAMKPAPAPEPVKPRAEAPKPVAAPEMTGRDFLRWCERQDEEYGAEVVKHISGWAKKRGLPPLFKHWNAQQITAARAEASRHVSSVLNMDLAGVA